MNRLKFFLGSVALLGAISTSRADEWTTTEPGGTTVRTQMNNGEEAARDYSGQPSAQRGSNTTTVIRGAGVPFNNHRHRPNTIHSSRLTVGTYYPVVPQGYYPYQAYPYPVYPQPLGVPSYPNYYGGSVQISKHMTLTPLGRSYVQPYPYPAPVYGYPAPGYGYPAPGYYPAPQPYPYYSVPQQPAYEFYGYDGPGVGGISGSYQSETNSTYGGISIGRGGPRVSIGGNRSTTRSTYSTFP